MNIQLDKITTQQSCNVMDRKTVREVLDRLNRLSSMGNYADRLGALSLLAYAFDRHDRELEKILVWMNASSQNDAHALLQHIHHPRNRRKRHISRSRYDSVIKKMKKLEQDIELPHLSKKGIIKEYASALDFSFPAEKAKNSDFQEPLSGALSKVPAIYQMLPG